MIVNYSTKQRGYGRQSLYVDVKIDGVRKKDVYVQDVFPNVQEHFDFLLAEDACDHPDGIHFINSNGNGKYERTFKTIIEALQFFIDIEDLSINEWNKT